MKKVCSLIWLTFIAISYFCRGIQSVSEIPNFPLNNGKKIPSIGYGTWMANGQDLEKALEVALEDGYRYIDTAFLYGNEKVVGKVLNRWITDGKLKREDLYILTKLPPSGNRPEGVSKYLKKSLENLQLDYVDMYLVHVPFAFNEIGDNLFPFHSNKTINMDSSTDLKAIWKEMEKQVDAGLTKGIGLSNYNETQIKKVLEYSRIKPCTLQIELHPYLQQNKLVEFCKKNEILVIAYSPLGSPGLTKFFKNFQKKIDRPDILGDSTLKAIAAKYSKTTAQVLLRFFTQNGIVPIPKSTNPSRIKMNIEIFDFQLNDQEMNEIKALDKGQRLLNFSELFDGIDKHPEYPFKSQ